MVESSDLAFLDLPLEASNSYSLEDYNLSQDEYVTLVPSGLVEKYTSDFDAYLREWMKIVENAPGKIPLKEDCAPGTCSSPGARG